MNPALNPPPTFPCCPDQTEFLVFRSTDGFAAVDLNLVEGFVASQDEGIPYTVIHLSNGSEYNSTEMMPDLIARHAAVKKMRYSKERQESEPNKPAVVTPGANPTGVQVSKTASPASSSIWKTPPESAS